MMMLQDDEPGMRFNPSVMLGTMNLTRGPGGQLMKMNRLSSYSFPSIKLGLKCIPVSSSSSVFKSLIGSICPNVPPGFLAPSQCSTPSEMRLIN